MYEGLALALQENDTLIIKFYLLKGSIVCLFVCLIDCFCKNLTISMEYGNYTFCTESYTNIISMINQSPPYYPITYKDNNSVSNQFCCGT